MSKPLVTHPTTEEPHPTAVSSTDCKWHRRAAQRPEELFQAALCVFMEKGYRATRLDDVASQAKVTKPLIYHYFKDKDDLLLQALSWKIDQLLADLRAETATRDTPTEVRLRKVFEYAWTRWKRPEWGRFHGTLLVELREENPQLFRRWTEGSLLRRWEMIEGILRDGQDRGEVRTDLDPVAAARFLISGGTQLAWLHLHTSVGEFAPCKEKLLRETALDVFLKGIRPECAKQGNDR